MSDLQGKIQELYSLEQLSGGSGPVHDRHPLVKLLGTAVFLLCVLSFGPYELGRLTPYAFYPAVLLSLSDTPWRMLVSRAALALPFALLAGVSNLIFLRAPALSLGPITLSLGALSFLVILLRTALCVTAVLLLAAVTPLRELSRQLRLLRVPAVFVLLLEMTYRYLGTLLAEAASMRTAYLLRGGGHRGVELRHMGSFVGHLLLRSFDRAERVYAAMKCRGYTLDALPRDKRSLTRADWIYLSAVCLGCALFRLFNIPAALGGLMGSLL